MPRLNFKCLVSVISLLSSLSRAKQSWLCLQLSSNNVLPSSYVRLGLQVRAQRLRFWKLPPVFGLSLFSYGEQRTIRKFIVFLIVLLLTCCYRLHELFVILGLPPLSNGVITQRVVVISYTNYPFLCYFYYFWSMNQSLSIDIGRPRATQNGSA